MSQSKRRGTFEERKAQAIQREADRLQAVQDAKDLRHEQELQAWRTMVWWQVEMTEERYNRWAKRKHKRDMDMAVMAGTLASAFGTFTYRRNHGGIGGMR